VIRTEWLDSTTMRPRFSILVPTRQRPDTLPATLETLTWHAGDDYEIVVADNCGDEQVAAVIKAAQRRHPRVKHIRSDTILPMGANWERGLAACSGEYVSVLGDDDGFLPNTLDLARKILAATNAKLFTWKVHRYWWPNTIAYWQRNRLCLFFGSYEIGWAQSRAALIETYRNPPDYEDLPMIYNSFVHREVIDAAIDRLGGYFVPNFISPDIVSGIVNLACTSQYLRSSFPLSIRGISKRSVGLSFWARTLGKELQDTYFKEIGKTRAQITHSSMPPAGHVNLDITSTKLFVKDLLFPHDNELQIDLRAAVTSVIAGLAFDADSYEENLAEALQLADRIGFVVDPKTIPPKKHHTYPTPQGPLGAGADLRVAVNCDLANVFDVAGAARLAAAISPEVRIETGQSSAVEEPIRRAS
jgi:glycosyltransferase involved in cell wall biosynthesis